MNFDRVEWNRLNFAVVVEGAGPFDPGSRDRGPFPIESSVRMDQGVCR